MKWLWVTLFQNLFTLFLYAISIAILGLSIFPGALFCVFIWKGVSQLELGPQILSLCFAAVTGYFIFGFTLIVLVGVLRFGLRLGLKEGDYPAFSLGAVKWAFANGLQLLVSNTFMDFVLLTPFANLVFRVLGAKLGKNVQINSKYCGDLSLLEVGDNSVIGGHATVIGHSFERKGFVLRKVRIGKNVVVGLNSVILPGTEIGDGSIIAAGAIVSKNTKVLPRSVMSGMPAESSRDRRARKKED